jgi:hydroxymethylpyrimidine/phosphomethylpyrimidine kinase
LEEIFLPFSDEEEWKVETWNVDFSKVASKRLFNVYELLTSNVKEAKYLDKKPFENNAYGEYKLVLQEVTYQYCTND